MISENLIVSIVSFSQLSKILRGIGAGIILLLVVSCAASRPAVKDDNSDRIRAENSRYKQHLPLIERENDVLKRENLQYQAKVRGQVKKIKSLQSELEYLKQKYERDMAVNQEQIKNLREEYVLLENNSFRETQQLYLRYDELEAKKNEKIMNLEAQIDLEKRKYARDMALNKERIDKLEEKYILLSSESVEKIEKLTQQLTTQKAEFQKAEAALKQEYVAKEQDLLKRISELNQDLNTHENQISSLKTAHNEISRKLDDTQQQLKEVESDRDKIKKELDGQKSSEAVLPQETKNTLN